MKRIFTLLIALAILAVGVTVGALTMAGWFVGLIAGIIPAAAFVLAAEKKFAKARYIVLFVLALLVGAGILTLGALQVNPVQAMSTVIPPAAAPATGNVADLQKQVTDLQTKLDQANKDLAAAKSDASKLPALQAQITDLQTKLDQAGKDLAAAKAGAADPKQIADLQAQVTDLKGKLDKANADLAQSVKDLTAAKAAIPTAAPTAKPGTVADPETFTYTPGGANYVFPEDKTHDPLDEIPADLMNGETGWQRIRIAANGQPLAWTFLVRIKADSDIKDFVQWDSATKLLVTNPSDKVLNVSVEIQRDFLAEGKHVAKDGIDYGCGTCTPYEDANAKKSSLGLGWFITGTLTDASVNGSTPVTLKGIGVFQMSFPKDMTGKWTIVLAMKPGAQATINQGEKLTTVDTWPLPAAK